MHSTIFFTALAAITPIIVADHAPGTGQLPIFVAGDSCTINSGASGECMLVSDCRAQGGAPEAGAETNIPFRGTKLTM